MRTYVLNYRNWLVVAAGILLAVVLYRVWSLPTRWFAVVIASCLMVSLSLIFVRRFGDFLVVGFLLHLPLAGVQKWLFLDWVPENLRRVVPFTGVMTIGLTEFLLAGMYFHWFVQVFVTRTAKLPRFQKFDLVLLLLFGANLVSLTQATNWLLSLFALGNLAKYFLIYFYLSRRLRREHLRWVFIAVILAIFMEAMLGFFQYKTGKLTGLMMDKGAGGELLNYQYTVPGIEHLNRATGTSYDSHSLGLFLSMLLPYPFVILMSSRKAGAGMRILCIAALAVGAAVLFVTFSRSAWLTCVLTLAFLWALFLFWRVRHIWVKTIALAMLALIPAPKAAEFVAARFGAEGYRNITTRFAQFPVAWEMWKDHFWFGQGIGNYMVVLDKYTEPGVLELPVHNVILWVAAEIGLVGLLASCVVVIAAMRRLWRTARTRREPTALIAASAMAGLVAYVIDGLTNPLFRESLVYMMFWFTVALAVALPRIQRDIDEQALPLPIALDERGDI